MSSDDAIKKVAFVGDYLPRKCGIATFTHDLRHAVADAFPSVESDVVAINDAVEDSYDYPGEVCFEIEEQHSNDYRDAADFLSFNEYDVVCLQHEYGIFGGKAGSHVLSLLRGVGAPVITTLHTILEEPNEAQRLTMDEIVRFSSKLVVMSERGREMLRSVHNVPERKIALIEHGIPDMPFVDPTFYKDKFGVEGKKVLLTFGLLSPGKGLEHVIEALPAIVEKVPNLVYIILGATHPNLVREQGETYRFQLERLAKELGVDRHVAFYNRFVELEELKEFIGAADIYVTPYLNRQQITSGTLSYAFGCGKAVVSTPYWHAEELLADGLGALVPFENAEAIASSVIDLFQDEVRLGAMRKRAYLAGRDMTWSATAQKYMSAFLSARELGGDSPTLRLQLKTLESEPTELPELKLDHLRRLTDSTGLLQHARYSIPKYGDGYCTDDNARALLLTVLLTEQGLKTALLKNLGTKYASFMDHAFDHNRGRFRNFMSYERQWLEDEGSDDCHGRSLWVLGTTVARSRRKNLQKWASELFLKGLPAIGESPSPRTWAFALFGICEYLRRFPGDRGVNQARDTFTERLCSMYDRVQDASWCWFEPVASYGNAKLSRALIVVGDATEDSASLERGLKSLRWLTKQQTSESGHFSPIGSNGFFPKGGVRATFDQQPIEAHAMVSAASAAFQATGDRFWITEARRAFQWFLGRNVLGEPLYDPSSGACFDGLHEDRRNLNQGAESTLAFLLALQEMRALEAMVEAFEPPASTAAAPLSALSA